MNKISNHHAGLLIAIIGAVLFSTKSIIAKLLYKEGIDATTLIALRMLLATPFFIFMYFYAAKGKSKIVSKEYLQIFGLGFIGYYLSSYLDFLGLETISAGLERLILFLTPSFVLIFSEIVYKRKASQQQWLSMLFAYVGIAFVFWNDLHFAKDGNFVPIIIGAGFVLGAAVSYASYLLFSEGLLKKVGTLRLVSLAMLASSVFAVGQFLLLRGGTTLFIQKDAVWLLSLYNAIVCTVFPVTLTMLAISKIGSSITAQAGMLGPVSTLFIAFWILGEPITLIQLVGTTCVLVGMMILANKPKNT